VVGPTGCGKSTLLNVAAGCCALGGSVAVFGKPLARDQLAGRLTCSRPKALMRRNTLRTSPAASSSAARPRGGAGAGPGLLKRVGSPASEALFPPAVRRHAQARALAQMLILDPQILLMDERSRRSTIQTRKLMENELLELSGPTKSVVFITTDLERRSRVRPRRGVVAGRRRIRSATKRSDLPRPRDVARYASRRGHRDPWPDLACNEGRSAERL